MDSGLVGQLARGQNQGRGGGFVPLKRQGGGRGLCRRLGQRDAYTTETRMEHMVNGELKQNGIRRTGPRCGVTRDVRNTFTKVLGTTRSKRDHRNDPKRKDESPHTKRY